MFGSPFGTVWVTVIVPGEVFRFTSGVSALDGTLAVASSLLPLPTRGTVLRTSLMGDRLTASPHWVPVVKRE